MKKVLYILLFLFTSISFAQANPGDTTWVQANQANLNWFGNFDTTTVFPDGTKTYRKIYMIFTMGQYNCPNNPQYCHQWDYTVSNYIMTPGGDTMEMCRFITPFATSGWDRFGSSWKQPYVFDVTDFYPLLQDTASVRIHYSGYSGGFTADIKFAFIEGTPDRNVTGIKEIYSFSHSYGDTANPINDALPTLTETVPTGTESARLKFLVTGHGSDANQCCEFDSHYYKVNLNSNTIAQKDIWRDDCGLNNLYPQGGTWVYNRGNWCPGALVRPIYHTLPNITANSQYDINIQFEDYTVASNFGSYSLSAIVFYYDDLNKNLDASLKDIIAPTNNPNHYRANPSGSIPQILVHNSGKTTITSINFTYGIQDSTIHNYSWQGSIAPLADTLIDLPALSEITNLSIKAQISTQQFNVAITEVNGQTDDDSTNNHLSSKFEVAPIWPGDIILTLKTGNFTGSSIGNPNQEWVITDMNGNVIASRENTSATTTYTDTVALPAAGFYRLRLTSGNGMGLHWWPYDQNNQIEAGSFTVKKMNGDKINMNNYSYSSIDHDDWGAAYSQYFTVPEAGQTDIATVSQTSKINIYPNPAQNVIHIDFITQPTQEATIELLNVLGQKIYSHTGNQKQIDLNTKSMASGVYTLRIIKGENNTITQKVVIRK